MIDEQYNVINEWSLEGEVLHTPKKTMREPGYNPLLDREGYCYYDYLRDLEKLEENEDAWKRISKKYVEFRELLGKPVVKVDDLGKRFLRLLNEAKSKIERPLTWEHWNLDKKPELIRFDGYCSEIFNSSDDIEIENLKRYLEDWAKIYDSYEKLYPLIQSELEKQPEHLEIRKEYLDAVTSYLRTIENLIAIPEITFEKDVRDTTRNFFDFIEGDLSLATSDYVRKFIEKDCNGLKEAIKNFLNNSIKTDAELETRLKNDDCPIYKGPVKHGIKNTAVSTGFDKIYPWKVAGIDTEVVNEKEVKQVGLPLSRGRNGGNEAVLPVAYQYKNGKGEPDPWENRILEKVMSAMIEEDPESIKRGRIQPKELIRIGKTALLRMCLGVDNETDVRPQMDDFIETLNSLKERTIEIRSNNLKGHIIGIDDDSEVFSTTIQYPLLDFLMGKALRDDGSVIEEIFVIRSYPPTEWKDYIFGQRKYLPSNLDETPKMWRSEMKSKTQDLADKYNLWNNPKDPPDKQYVYIQGYKTNAVLKDWILKQIVLGPKLDKNPPGKIKMALSELYDTLDLTTGKRSSKKTRGDRRKIAGQYLLYLMEKGNSSIYGFEFEKERNEYKTILISVSISDKE